MKKSKKFLSVILAVLMAFSSLTVGFYAIAAETAESGDAEEKSAVAELQDAMKAFYDAKYSTLMFSTKEAEAEQKAEALKAFDELCADLKALTEAEKTELPVSYYVFVLSLAADQVGRDAGKSGNAAKIYGITDGLDKVTEKIGALPAEYKAGYDAVKAIYTMVGGKLFNSSFDFKAVAAGNAHFEAAIEIIKKLSPAAFAFANYASPNTNAFYMYCSKPDSTSSNFLSNIEAWAFNYFQDQMSATGKGPSISYSTFIDRQRVDNVYVNAWKGSHNAVTYKEAYENYDKTFRSDVVAPSKEAFAMLLDIFSAVYGKGVKEAGELTLEKGLAYYNTGNITVAEIEEVLAAIDALDKDAENALNGACGYYQLKMTSKLVFPIEYTAETSVDDVYSNQIKTESKTVTNLLNDMKTVLSDLQLEEFLKLLASADADDAEQVKAAYAALPTSHRSKLTVDQYAKLLEVVKPAADKNDFAAEAAAFKTIPVNRADIGDAKDALGQYIARDIIWSEEGVQNSVDGTYALVKTVVNMLKPEINGKPLDLSNGLNDLIKDNVYQASVINAIYDLYANLSHNETETGVGMVPTIGSVISMLISKNGIRGELVQGDNKFAAAIAKIDALPSVTPEEKEQGINDLDKIASIDFTDADFGFKNGDKDGFIDALLAALRPITYLLSGDNGILGIAGVKIRMFEITDDEGNYSNPGIYAMLVPLLEQIGLTDLPTPIEYRTNYYTVRETMGKNLGYDEILRPVIESLFKNIVQPIADVPLDGVIDILPRIAYVLNTNMVNDTIKAVLNSTGDTLAGLAGGLDLSAKAVNNMISGVVIELDENTSIRLKPINWHILSDCATVDVVKSNSGANEYVMVRTGDADSCLSTVFFYIHSILLADKANYNAIRALLANSLDKLLFTTITSITDKLAVGDRNEAFAQFLVLTAGEAGETAIPITKADAQKRFIDLSNFRFYDDYVAYTSVYNSFITGTDVPKKVVFSPTAAITRAMFVTILYRMAGEPYKDANPYEKTPFTDITDTTVYYYDAACWALDNGITNQTTFRATDNVSRQETASFLFRYAQANDMILNENYKEADLTSFSDYNNISEWAREAMQWANFNGMITGTAQGTANPQGDTQRIHATKILYGFGKNCDIGNFV